MSRQPWIKNLRKAIEASYGSDVFAIKESFGNGLVGRVGEVNTIEAQILGSFCMGDRGQVDKLVINFTNLPTPHLLVEVILSAIAASCLQRLRHICSHFQAGSAFIV